MNEEAQFDASDDEFERRLEAVPMPRPPEGLLERCLETIDGISTTPALVASRSTPSSRRTRRWAYRAAAIAAGIAIIISGVWVSSGDRNLLADVYKAMDQSPAYHIHWTTARPARSRDARQPTICGSSLAAVRGKSRSSPASWFRWLSIIRGGSSSGIFGRIKSSPGRATWSGPREAPRFEMARLPTAIG